MNKKELLKRYALFVLSLFFIGLGIGFAKHGDIGISPVSSVPYVMNLKFEFFSIGNWLTVSNCLFLLGQVLILRKQFKLIQLLQIPLSFLFGCFTDLGVWLVHFLPVSNYAVKLLYLAISIVIIAFGISLGVIANVLLNSPEAFVKAISDTTKKDFGSVKTIFDVCWVSLAIILSFAFTGKLVAVREGTILTALLVGIVVKLFVPKFKEPLTNLLKK